jgi:hypothetical protein
MSIKIKLPTTQGRSELYVLTGISYENPITTGKFNRIAFSAAHVVANPFSNQELNQDPQIDWDKTIAYRRYLINAGFGIAEAMDTAQRGMGLNWSIAKELIERTTKETSDLPGALIYSGCGTEQLNTKEVKTIGQVITAYKEQLDDIQKLGSKVIMMSSRALTHVAKTPDDYITVYSSVLQNANHPVILHWLGDMFDPELAGYWGGNNFDQTMETCLTIINQNTSKIDGIKISLLDKEKEIRMRRLLPKNVKMYTGDDFNYPELIKGDDQGFSHALLGIFDPIAVVASHALSALTLGDIKKYDALMAPTIPLSRLIFRTPTQYYKTGVVFLAYLNGHQDHFIMVGGQQSARPLQYFVDIFRLADKAGLFTNPEMATSRMQLFLQQYSFAQ